MDPASAILLFVLFQATEKAVSYAGGKIADSMSKPIWEALEEKAKWLAGRDETAKRWAAFSQAYAEAGTKLKAKGRHPELAKQVVDVLMQFDLKTLPDNQWLDELAIQLEKASLVSEKPDERLLVELFLLVLPQQPSRAELSETVADFVSIFQDILFAQPAYQVGMFKRAQWQALRQPRYDTRERYISQVIEYNENLDFVGIPELKDRQALRIEDVFISLQTQIEELSYKEFAKDLLRRNTEEHVPAYLEENKPKISRRLSVNQALTESQKIVMLGDPGSGKTTLLKYIVLAFAENKADKLGLTETRLPIFIRLYDYVAKREECAKDGFSFTDYLNKYCADHLQLRLQPDFFEKALENGECCVCFDGLDELGAAGLRREITLAVSAMANRYARNRFIVTSRLVGYEEAPLDRNDFAHHTVLPLGDEDIKLFVEKWYKARERDVVIRRERTEHLVKTVMGEERIKSLASNPLMLTIIALVHRIEAELPHERVKLYDKCVTTLMETWDKVRGMKTGLRRRLLEKLAYWMHSQPGEKGRTREVREGTLRLQLAHFLQSDPKNKMDEDEIQKEVENFIALVKTRSGLLVERGEGVYTFSHLTFQEFLAACDIEKGLAHSTDALWNEIQPHLHDAYWREVILLLLGSLNRFEEHNSVLVQRIYESSDIYEPVLHRHLFFCAQALSDHVEVESTLHDQIVDDLLKLTVSTEPANELAKNDAFKTLGSLQNDSRAGEGLLMLSRDGKMSGSVRCAAAKVLGQLGRADEAARLLLVLASDEKVEPAVHDAAVHVLGQLGRADELVQLLLASLVGDGKAAAEVLGVVAQALGNLGRVDEAVLNGLLAMAGNEGVADRVRRDAAHALGNLGRADEAVLNGLLALAGDEKVDVQVNCAAVQALGELGCANEAVLNGLLALAGDKKVNNYVLSDVAQALGKLGWANEAALNGLLALASDEKVDDYVRSAAAQALGKLGRADEAVLNGLLALAGDEKVFVSARCAAAEAIGQLGRADEAARLLLALAGAAADYVRSAAVQALGKLGHVDEEVFNGLLTLAGDEKAEVPTRSAAMRVLGQLKRANETVLSGLLALASDEKVDDYVRSAAAQALGQLGLAEEAARLLLAMTTDEKMPHYLRSGAAEALGQLGCADRAILDGLLALAVNQKVHAGARNDAVKALGKLGHVDEKVLNGLLVLAGDKKVRYSAYNSLKQLLG